MRAELVHAIPDLPFASTVSMVTYFRQALALDERRVKFQPEFRRHDPNLPQPMSPPPNVAGQIPRNKEVWFRGVHSSVGGSSDPDDGPSLSNIPFRWMLWEAVQCDLRTGPISILQSYAFMSIPTVAAYIPACLSPAMFALFHQPIQAIGVSPMVLPRNVDRGSITQIRAQFNENHRRHVIHLAAQYDTTLSLAPGNPQAAVGQPTTQDLLSDFEDSLCGLAYWMMDYAPLFLQRRWYALGAAGNYAEHRDRW